MAFFIKYNTYISNRWKIEPRYKHLQYDNDRNL